MVGDDDTMIIMEPRAS